MNQHQDVQREIVADVKGETRLDADDHGDRQQYRQPVRHPESGHHGDDVRHRVDHAVAEVIE